MTHAEQTTARAPSAPRGRPIDDDMHDSAAELSAAGRLPPLRAALEEIDDELVDAFDHLDRRAIRNQRLHRRITLLTAVTGSAALLASALDVALARAGGAGGAAGESLDRLETALVLVTGALVALGVMQTWLLHWLLDRFKAEQLRLLKFAMLVDPRLWSDGAGDRAAWQDELQRRRNAILLLGRSDLARCAEQEAVPTLPEPSDCAGLDAAAMDALLDYYRRKRLDAQMRYFERARAHAGHWYDGPRLVQAVFFGSVLCVGLRLVVEDPALDAALFAASAGLPAVWAGWRTWRSANEFQRNAARSLARQSALRSVLAHVDRRRSATAPTLLSYLLFAETMLEADQREWLRLMRDAEWYG
jgi:hypothetical protein